MIEVHHLNNSRSQRILWLLEELGLDYEIVRYQRDPVTRFAPPAIKAIHPLGKSPVIRDGDLVVEPQFFEQPKDALRAGIVEVVDFNHGLVLCVAALPHI